MLNNKVIARDYVEKNYISKETIRNKINKLEGELLNINTRYIDRFTQDRINHGIIREIFILKGLLDEGETNDGDKTR